MPKPIYLTTPLYYVNAAPHIGHSYTNIAADCLRRYHRAKGQDVFLLTGTDEHGQKIAQAASAAGQSPKAFVDEVVGRFKTLWTLLGVEYDGFIRTTDPLHERAVQAILTILKDQGKLHRAAYEGWYCTPDETFWTAAELAHAGLEEAAPPCPACRRPLERITEEGWHLPLRGEHQRWLLNFVRSHPDFVRPPTRYNELMSVIEQPLPESLCITRPRSRVAWGIPVPFDPDHVVYVWFDALLNYITAAGYPADRTRFARLWPADAHFIGKDILRHHAIYWPIMLRALGFPDEAMPRTIIAHGWWKIGAQKMSKSLGNIVDPLVVIGQLLKGQPYAADVYRYFLLREIPFGQDGNFSEEAILTRLHADLANDLGNLVHRTGSMIARYCGGKIPPAAPIGCAVEDEPLRRAATGLVAVLDEAMSRVDFSAALEAIMQVVTRANRYLEETAPWKLAKQTDDPEAKKRLHTVLRVTAEAVRVIAITLGPCMPAVAEAIWRQLGCGASHPFNQTRLADVERWPGLTEGQPLGPHPILFPRTDATMPS